MKKIIIAFILLLVTTCCFASVYDGALLVIDDPLLLSELEVKGSNIYEKIADTTFSVATNKKFYKNTYYKSIVDSLAYDLDKIKQKDKLLSVTMAKSHRLFNKNWLKSKYAKFELVGIINRLDRASFNKRSQKNCGEIRFIYRLAYMKGSIYTQST